jgi:hypothetical protein
MSFFFTILNIEITCEFLFYNFYNFEYQKSELGLDCIFTVAIDTIYFYVIFIINLVTSF